jgi:hypothetical protein
MPLTMWADNPLVPLRSVADGSDPGQEHGVRPDSRRAEPSAQEEPLQSANTASKEEEVMEQIRNLPPEFAVLLLSVGALGFILPGVIGTPALIAGGLALWPKAFGRADAWFARRCPQIHRKSLHQMGRFLADLERRYARRADAPIRGGHGAAAFRDPSCRQ